MGSEMCIRDSLLPFIHTVYCHDCDNQKRDTVYALDASDDGFSAGGCLDGSSYRISDWQKNILISSCEKPGFETTAPGPDGFPVNTIDGVAENGLSGTDRDGRAGRGNYAGQRGRGIPY